MEFLILFISGITVLQLIMLVLSWRSRRDPILHLSTPKKAQAVVHVLRARNQIRAISVFASAILSKTYGSLTLSQIEFLSQIQNSCKDAAVALDTLATAKTVSKSQDSSTEEDSINPILSYLSQSTRVKNVDDLLRGDEQNVFLSNK